MDRIIGGLQAQLESFQTNWAEQDRRASESRQGMHEKLEGFGKDVVSLTHKVEGVIEDVKEMKPAVQDWVANKARAEGVAWSAKILWIGLGASVATIAFVFNHFLSIVPHSP
jgi:hypothetical protein